MASMNDIIIGRNNTHAYQTGESTGNYQRRMTYTKFGPSEKDSFNIIVNNMPSEFSLFHRAFFASEKVDLSSFQS